jgi:hypothetical protein
VVLGQEVATHLLAGESKDHAAILVYLIREWAGPALEAAETKAATSAPTTFAGTQTGP